jgi:hypothetical protein
VYLEPATTFVDSDSLCLGMADSLYLLSGPSETFGDQIVPDTDDCFLAPADVSSYSNNVSVVCFIMFATFKKTSFQLLLLVRNFLHGFFSKFPIYLYSSLLSGFEFHCIISRVFFHVLAGSRIRTPGQDLSIFRGSDRMRLNFDQAFAEGKSSYNIRQRGHYFLHCGWRLFLGTYFQRTFFCNGGSRRSLV